METLQLGSSGASVTQLQARLRDRGFPPGDVDGSFGPATEAAVLAFQRSEGLLADGVVGSRTAAALGFLEMAMPGMPVVPMTVAARMFPSATVDAIEQNMPLVLESLQAKNLTSVPIVSAALATISVETGRFVPIDEYVSRFNTSPGGRPFDLYDWRKDLGNRGPPDGANFKGRGYVQLTGRANYAKYGPLVGEPTLVEHPERANEPAIAARLLAAFIASKEIPMKQALQDGDLAAARRLVNGGTYGLAQFETAYRIGMAGMVPAT